MAILCGFDVCLAAVAVLGCAILVKTVALHSLRGQNLDRGVPPRQHSAIAGARQLSVLMYADQEKPGTPLGSLSTGEYGYGSGFRIHDPYG
jgi:hypothetical protein